MIDKKKFTEVDIDIEPLYSEKKSLKISLEYYLIESFYKDEEELDSKIKTFGVEVVKKEHLPDNALNIETKIAEHLSLDKQKVESILSVISKNTVTPIGLYGVLDDMLGTI